MGKRKHEGNIPADGELVGEHDGWQLYKRNTVAGWTNFKLVSAQPIPHKANYWIGACSGRLTNSDAYVLKRHLPELYQWVVSVTSR